MVKLETNFLWFILLLLMNYVHVEPNNVTGTFDGKEIYKIKNDKNRVVSRIFIYI
jgi:hypothetical protein